MTAVLEARAVITAKDDTGPAFASLKERIAAVTRQAEVMNRTLGAVGAVSKNVEGFKLPPSAMADMGKFVETASRVETTMANVNRSAAAVAGNVGKASAEVVGLSSKLMEAGAKLKAISDFKGTSRGVKEAALAAEKAQQDARLLAAKIDGSPTPTRSLQAAHMSALAEVRETEAALAKQVAVAAQARTALAELGVPVNRLSAEEERLKSVLDGTNAALLRQIELERQGAAAAEKAAAAQRLSAEQEKRHHDALVKRFAAEDHARHGAAGHGGGHDHGFVNYALTSAAMAVSAHAIGHVIAEGWHEGAELQHERMQLKNAGRTPEEMREIEAAGRSTISALPTANFTETMKVVAETTSAFGSVHHAIDNLPFMMKAMSVLKSAGGSHIQGDAAAVGQAFAKTFEERQTKAEDFQREASAMIPAMVATGGLFNPNELYAFAQQAESALPNYGMRFLSKIAPSLITAQGGERAGTAANAFNSIIMGKVNDKKQTEAWEKFGLLDDKMVLKKAGHAVSWTAGAVKDTDLALTDPLEWAEKVVLPAMRDKGIDVDNRLELAKVLGTMFRNQNGNMFANEIMQAASRSRLHKDEALFGKTGDLDTIYKNDLGEFNVAAGALGESLKTLGAAASAPMMHRVAESLSWLAGALNKVSAFGLQHPTIAATAGVGAAAGALGAAGWLGKMLFDGFGLKGSAVALTGSAEALDAAAVRLGAGGPHGPGGPGGTPTGPMGRAANAAEHAAEGASGGAALNRVVNGGPGVAGAVDAPPTAASVAPAAALELGAGALAFGGGIFLAETVRKAFEAQEPGQGGLYAPVTEESRDRDTPDVANLKMERERLAAEVARQKAMEKIPGTSDAATMAQRDRIAQLDGAIALKEHSLSDLDAAASHEARVGRAMMAMKRPEAFGPDMPEGYSPKYGRVLSREEFGPAMPNLPDTDRADRARRTDLGWLGRTLRRWEGAPARAEVPLPERAFVDQRVKDDVTPLPHGGGPVPVQIVGTSTEHMPTRMLPPGMHPDFTLGNNSGGFGSPGLGASGGFDRGPRGGAAGFAALDAHPVEPHVDDSALVALDAKLTEVGAHAQAVGATPISIKADASSIEAMIGLLTRAIALKAQLGSMPGGGGTSGAVGTSYPQTAPAGRNGGGR